MGLFRRTEGSKRPTRRTRRVLAALTIVLSTLVYVITPFAPAPGVASAASGAWYDIGGQFDFGQWIAADSAGDLFVQDTNTIWQRVSTASTWTDTGLQIVGGGYLAADAGNLYGARIYGGPSGTPNIIVELKSGSTAWTDITDGGVFNAPAGIAVDGSGDVFVVNNGNNTIVELKSGSTTWTNITYGGAFDSPKNIAADTSGNVYVVNSGNNTIEELKSGSTTWTNITYGASFNNVVGIAADAFGNVYVANGTSITLDELNSGSTTWTNFPLPSNLTALQGVAVDGAGHVYILNRATVLEYSSSPILSPPTGLSASETTQANTVLTWNAEPGATSYDVYLNGVTTPLVTGLTGTSYSVTGLTQASNTFAVSAVDAAGQSGLSSPLAVVGLSAPSGLTVGSVTQSGATISWGSVPGATSYDVYRFGASSPFVTGLTGTSYTLTGLSPGTSGYTVTAVNGQGQSVQSAVILVSPVPASPTGLQAGGTTSTTTTLSWNGVTGATTYDLYSEGDPTPFVTGITGTTYTVTKLLPGATYTFTVSAVSAGGTSAPGAPLVVTLTPAAPTGLQAVSTSATGTTLTWTAATGASTYNVYENGTRLAAGVTGTSYVVTGLSPGTPYTFTVTAVGPGGESGSSGAATVSLASVPAVPSGLVASATTSSGTTLTWNAETGTVTYNVYEDGGSTPIAHGLSGPSYTVTGLKSGTQYSFTVAASNTSGASGQSAAVDVLLAPSAPTGLQAGDTTATSTTLTWGAVTGAQTYEVYEDGASVPVATGLTGTTYALTGLSPGTSYTFTVRAVDATGQSDASAALAVNTPAIGSIQLTSSGTDVFVNTAFVVTGTVYDVNQAAVAGATVSLSSPAGVWSATGTSHEAVTTTASGEFSASWTAPSSEPSVTTVTITVQYAANLPSKTMVVTVAPPLGITTTTLPDAVAGQPYAQTIDAAGVFSPNTWSLTSGNLPPGLSLNTASGLISGTPTSVGSSTFTVQVKDAAGNVATQNLTLAVAQPPSVSTTILSNARLRRPYSETLGAVGGSAPYSWSVTSGSLPQGLTLNSSTGQISGSPTTLGTAVFLVQVEDSAGHVGSRILLISVGHKSPGHGKPKKGTKDGHRGRQKHQ